MTYGKRALHPTPRTCGRCDGRQSRLCASEFRFLWRADLPPVVFMLRFPSANEPCRKHAFAITLGYLTT